MLGPLAFRWLSKKSVLHQNNCAWWDFAQKCQCSWIFGKTKFLGKCLFHREMFCVTNFRLVLCICIVNAMIFIKKNIDKLVQDQFVQPVKDHPYE